MQKLKATKIKLVLLIGIIMGLVVMSPMRALATGSATLYTNPGGTQSVTVNGTFAVQVRINASVSPGAAEVFMSYPTSKLQIQSVSYAGSPYTIQLLESNSNGVLEMDRAAFSAIPPGDQLYATVSIKAIATGSAVIAFTNSSLVRAYSDNTTMSLTKSGVTYNIVSSPTPPPPPVTPPNPQPNPQPSPQPSTPPSPSPRPSPPPPSSGGGTTKKPTTPTSPTPPSATPTPSPTPPNADPLAEGSSQPVDSIGQPLDIRIVDKSNEPIKGAEVTIDGQTLKTGNDGVAHFENITPGDKQVAISYNGKKSTQNTQVLGASTSGSPESITLQIDRSKPSLLIFIAPAAIVLLLVGAFFARNIILSRMKSGDSNSYEQSPHDPMGTLVSGNGPPVGSIVAPGPFNQTPQSPPYIPTAQAPPPTQTPPPPPPPTNPLPPPPPST